MMGPGPSANQFGANRVVQKPLQPGPPPRVQQEEDELPMTGPGAASSFTKPLASKPRFGKPEISQSKPSFGQPTYNMGAPQTGLNQDSEDEIPMMGPGASNFSKPVQPSYQPISSMPQQSA